MSNRIGGGKMELLKVTKDIAIRCILFGACKVPKVDSEVSSYSTNDLIWADQISFSDIGSKKWGNNQ